MGYGIRVNGEVVWESEGSEQLVTEISVTTPRGEAAFVRVPPHEQYLDINVNSRSLELAPHDLVDQVRRDGTIGEVLNERFGEGTGTPAENRPEPEEASAPEPIEEEEEEPSFS